jgi:tetratricopeptide (TPR) repeat protein
MPEQLMQFDATKPLPRAVTILVLILALIGSWFVVRWYLGNTLAEFLDPDEHELSLGRTAVSLAPADPFTHWRLGTMVQRGLTPDQLPQVVSEYETAVALAPNDYRFWTVLGIALEQVGDSERGEKALRRATELAPAYAHPHWTLGNLLLRSGRYDEAFAELQLASTADSTFRGQLFNLAWEVYKQDLDSLKTAVGTTAQSRAEFSNYLVGRQRFEDGMLLWQSLTPVEKRTNRAAGEGIISTLVASYRYYQAAGVANDLVSGPVYRATEGNFVNGGFEENLTQQKGLVFGWQITSLPQAQILHDQSRSHGGSRSLRLVFQVRTRLDSIKVSQMVLVKPDSEYDFEYYVKTEKLQSGGTPAIEIFDPVEGKVAAVSEAAPNGDSDWRRAALSFKTGKKTEAVMVRFVRGSCGDDPVCPIFGNLWYDDFSFKRKG